MNIIYILINNNGTRQKISKKFALSTYIDETLKHNYLL